MTTDIDIETADEHGAIIRIDTWRAEGDTSGRTIRLCAEQRCRLHALPAITRCADHMTSDEFRAAVHEQGNILDRARHNRIDLAEQAHRTLGLPQPEILATFTAAGINDQRLQAATQAAATIT
ncbi:hypothetical protein, partial [Streptomyces calidiresistens]